MTPGEGCTHLGWAMTQKISFLGLDFDPLTAEQVAQAVARRARQMGPFAYVATPNADQVLRLNRQPHLEALYGDAWLTACDSGLLELLAEASYITLPAARSADIVENLFRQHVSPRDSIAIIGGTARMVEALRLKYGLGKVDWFAAPHGLYTDPEARAACVRFIRDTPARFVLLAVGSPQDEMIAQEARLSGACSGVAICCGAALAFLAGETVRAPDWMRARRLAWLFRLITQPRQMWKRYLIDGPRIFWMWCRWRNEPADASVAAGDMALSPR